MADECALAHFLNNLRLFDFLPSAVKHALLELFQNLALTHLHKLVGLVLLVQEQVSVKRYFQTIGSQVVCIGLEAQQLSYFGWVQPKDLDG